MRLPEVKSFRDRNQVVTGVVGLLLVAALTASVFAVSATGILEHRYQLTAVFETTGGLTENADVRLAGVPIGTVTSVDPDYERGVVVVTFEVDEGIDLGPGMTAEIASATLLGGYYLRPDGEVGGPHLAGLDRDDERRAIPIERTTGPTSLNQVLEDTTEAVSAIDFDLANRVVDQVAGAAERNVDTLPALIDDFAAISTALAGRDAEVRRLAESAERLTGTLADRDQELAQLIDTSGRFLAELAARRDELSAILASGDVAAGEASELLNRHRDAIDRILVDVGTVTGELADTRGQRIRQLQVDRRDLWRNLRRGGVQVVARDLRGP